MEMAVMISLALVLTTAGYCLPLDLLTAMADIPLSVSTQRTRLGEGRGPGCVQSRVTSTATVGSTSWYRVLLATSPPGSGSQSRIMLRFRGGTEHSQFQGHIRSE